MIVTRKDEKLECVNFKDINRASPNDHFFLPHIDILIDNAAKSSIYSFIDGRVWSYQKGGGRQKQISFSSHLRELFVTKACPSN